MDAGLVGNSPATFTLISSLSNASRSNIEFGALDVGVTPQRLLLDMFRQLYYPTSRIANVVTWGVCAIEVGE